MITTTYHEDENFRNSIFPTSMLADVIFWIGMNLDPEQVFDTYKLESWAEENDYVRVE